MAQKESRKSRDILAMLRSKGIFAFKVHGGPTMMAGLPDIICCIHGEFVGLEVKHEITRDKVSPRQTYVHEEIRKAGGAVWVVTSRQEVEEILADEYIL